MKRFLSASAAVICLTAFGFLDAAKPAEPQPAQQTAAPSDTRSYTQGFMPYLGGAYRNPDAYLPYYPGYAPYWQSAPLYQYTYPPPYYPYPLYPPVFMPADRTYTPRAVHRFTWH